MNSFPHTYTEDPILSFYPDAGFPGHSGRKTPQLRQNWGLHGQETNTGNCQGNFRAIFGFLSLNRRGVRKGSSSIGDNRVGY